MYAMLSYHAVLSVQLLVKCETNVMLAVRTVAMADMRTLALLCRYCGRAFLPHLYAPGGKGCTGQCLPQPHTTYPEEYKPPC